MTGYFITVLLIILAAYAGFQLKALSSSGTLAAIVVGLAVFLGFGAEGLILLGVFFGTSSLWSKYKSLYKSRIEEKLAKGSQRDWTQVAANGGPAALCSILFYFTGWDICVIAFGAAIASANSDTWASEIGPLSSNRPIFIRTLKRVEKGTSGAVSMLGTTAALAGALLIAGCALYLFNLPIWIGVVIFCAGFLGNLADTLIGAFMQEMYCCKKCGLETEKKAHCDEETLKVRGISSINNDLVNFLSGAAAILLSLVVLLFS